MIDQIRAVRKIFEIVDGGIRKISGIGIVGFAHTGDVSVGKGGGGAEGYAAVHIVEPAVGNDHRVIPRACIEFQTGDLQVLGIEAAEGAVRIDGKDCAPLLRVVGNRGAGGGRGGGKLLGGDHVAGLRQCEIERGAVGRTDIRQRFFGNRSVHVDGNAAFIHGNVFHLRYGGQHAFEITGNKVDLPCRCGGNILIVDSVKAVESAVLYRERSAVRHLCGGTGNHVLFAADIGGGSGKLHSVNGHGAAADHEGGHVILHDIGK